MLEAERRRVEEGEKRSETCVEVGGAVRLNVCSGVVEL